MFSAVSYGPCVRTLRRLVAHCRLVVCALAFLAFGSTASAFFSEDIAADDYRTILPTSQSNPLYFGYAVAASGDLAAIGAFRDNDLGSASGSVTIVELPSGNPLEKLTAPDGVAGDYFGLSLAMSDDYLLVGSAADPLGNSSGALYVYDAQTREFLRKIFPDDGQANAFFSISVALHGDLAIIGAQGDNGSAGSAYLFNLATGEQIEKFTPDGVSNRDYFGIAVGMDERYIAVGAYGDDDSMEDSGAVFLFDATTHGFLRKL